MMAMEFAVERTVAPVKALAILLMKVRSALSIGVLLDGMLHK